MRHARSRFAGLLAAVVTILAVLVPAGAAQASDGGPKLTVMTRNLYLGTGLTDIVSATTPEAFVAAVSQAWANVVATDFPTRAEALAEEVRRTRPDVIGLQEVTLWRDQAIGDSVLGVTTPNATNVVYDFLALLQAELVEAGVPYTAVSTSVNADVEAPRANPASPTTVTDVRLTDRDVILVRTPLAGKFSNPRDGHYRAQLTLPSAGGPVTFTRGWTTIDYRHDARTRVRIFNTHLEVEDPLPAAQVQVAQGVEALARIVLSPYPVIALGDFNSAADGSTTPTYKLLTTVLTDTWTKVRPGDPGLTCCEPELLDSVQPARTRIDLVLVSRHLGADRAELTGNTPFRASPPPLWASDHFGVVARVVLRR
jgi:endonuclease/exonuclease/phosphatase family metal-dependent hydrolase